MPSDTLSLTVGTGLGVSVLAGIISGVCFVIGYSRIHKKRETKWHCAVCNKYFRSAEFILGEADFVICIKCNRKICKSTCSSINPDTSWICKTCSETKNNWIYGAFKAVEPITKAFCAKMGLENELPDEHNEDQKAEEIKKKEQVRTFIESLVNNLLGDNIDDASINEIYNDRKYRKMFEKYHRDLSGILTDLGTSLQISLSRLCGRGLIAFIIPDVSLISAAGIIRDLPIVGESPCSAHSALKRIIQRIIREANDLPKLKNVDQSNSLNQENRTYEDLLSTAILNKIISSSQNNASLNSSRANSVSSHRSSSSRRRKLQKEYFFGEETLHNKKKGRNDTDTASISSLEEWVHSDSSRGSTKYVDRVSLTIKQRIQEVSSSDSDAEVESEENEDAEYLNFKSAFGGGEPNWFLQRRQFRGVSCSPVPVSMLVPDPAKEAKVLIGDKEIEDTSDLSDVPSDYEEHNDSIASMEVSSHLIDSKNLIGGKNSLVDFCSSRLSDDEISADSGVKECKYLDEVDSELVLTSNKDDSKFVADASLSSDGSNTERDTEYTEKYGTIPRRISISPNSDGLQGKHINDSSKNIEENNNIANDIKEEMGEEYTPEFTGVYSKREKEKWSQAVELKNNPYSKENIEKRIKSRNSINSLFGSDYYIRQASKPSGTKNTEVKTPPVSDEADTFQSEQYQETVVATNEIQESALVKIHKEKLCLMARPFDTTESDKLMIAKTDQSKSLEKEPKDTDLGTNFTSEISSDSEVSLVNCYDVTESVIYKKLSAENEEIQTAEKYFDFESLETSLNNPVEEVEQQNEKLVTEPITPTISEQPVEASETENVNRSELMKPAEIKHIGEETTAYIISKRSDNTLIRKIYSDPSVRSFALSRRKILPSTVEQVEFDNKPGLKYEKLGETSKPPVMKQYSSNNVESTEKKGTESKYFKSSRLEEHYPKQKPKLERESSLKYEKSPEFEKKRNLIDNRNTHETKTKASRIITEYTSAQNLKIETEIHMKNHKEGIIANSNKVISDFEALEEIDKLKKKKLVANRLREFSQSTFDLSSTDKGLNKIVPNFNEIDRKEDVDFISEKIRRSLSELQNRERSSSVRDLRKKFEKFDEDAKVEHLILHSLTGRSLSKQFKEKLRDSNGDIPSLSQIHSLSLTNLEVEDNTR